jgi:PPOX class probable F420-dependent enzyme
MGQQLTGRWAVYVGLERIGMLGTADENGMPHATPVYYALMDGQLYFGTQRGRKKARNLFANPQVSFTVDTRTVPYKGIVIQGKAVEVRDDALHERYREALVQRYYGSRDNPGWQYVQSLGNSVLFRIDAERIFHWDFSDIYRNGGS